MYQRVNLSLWLVIFAFFTAFGACAVAAGKIIYVDEIAAGANDGSSWDDAYNFLQDALADANESEKPVEIRLAQGSHSPDQDTPNPEGTADRQATFQLINGVALKGGYAGLFTPDPNARDVVLFETALVGEIRSTGFGGGNSYHIVTGSGTDETAVLDGLIIAGGNANGPRLGEEPNYDYRFRYGAGLYNDAGSPTLIDCFFIDNSAYIGGGGMYNSNGSSPTLTNCIFDWNSAVDGCGIYNSNSNPTLTGCVFSTNIAQNNGGGIYNEQSNPILTDCVFIDNSGHNGGGIYNSESNPTLTDCSFIANTTLTIRSTDNTLSGGGGIYNDHSSPILSNCIFTENSAYAALSNLGGAIFNNDNSNPVLTDCLFSMNWSENYGGGIYNCESSPILTDCVFNGNWAEEYGGGMYNKQSNPTLTDCLIVWNWAAVITSYHDSYPSGAGMYNEASSPILSACVISGNYAEGDGAGMYNSNSSPELANCIIAGNWTADFGGAMYVQAGNPTLTNCTFLGNIAYKGNALACDSPQQNSPGNVEMTNCILWDGGSEIWNNDDSVITINYSNIQGGFPGNGNIDTDPLFTQAGYWANFYDPNIVVEPDDPNASWTDGDYRLNPCSPCINHGDPNYISGPNETDLDGNPRVVGGRIDMGAYEYPFIYAKPDEGAFPGSWWKYSENPVFSEAMPGQWDNRLNVSVAVLKDSEEPVNKYKMWYVGGSQFFEGAGIGYATSTDGINWIRSENNPVLEPRESWNVGGFSGICVIKDGPIYKLWYEGSDNESTARIGYATSSDGINWDINNSNPVFSPGDYDAWDDDDVGNPCVVKEGSTYKMWYWGDNDLTGIDQIGLAVSNDGISWQRVRSEPVIAPDPSIWWQGGEGIGTPQVLRVNSGYVMAYHAADQSGTIRIGLATSSDGLEWKKEHNPILDIGSDNSWDSISVVTGSLIQDASHLKLWYFGIDDSEIIKLGLAVSCNNIVFDIETNN